MPQRPMIQCKVKIADTSHFVRLECPTSKELVDVELLIELRLCSRFTQENIYCAMLLVPLLCLCCLPFGYAFSGDKWSESHRNLYMKFRYFLSL